MKQARGTMMGAGDKVKDRWDKADVVCKAIGSIFLPLVVVVVGLLGSYQLARIKDQLDSGARDMDVVEKFQKIYVTDSTRSIAVFAIRSVRHQGTRNDLQRFVYWDILQRHMGDSRVFKFDSEKRDWHVLGELFQRMHGDDLAVRRDLWLRGGESACQQWPSAKNELKRLFEWINATYELKEAAVGGKCDG
jgi:hypothetical protein